MQLAAVEQTNIQYDAYGGGQRPLVRSRTAAVRSE